jgi:hypothetical protein
VHRRLILCLPAVAVLAGCGGDGSAEPAASTTGGPPSAVSSSTAPVVPSSSRAAVAADYRWLAAGNEFGKGFSFVWVKGLTTSEVLSRLGGKELERVFWHQLVGPGDGQRGPADVRYFGVARIDDWVLIVEDNGTLGTSDDVLRPLSAKTTVVAHYRSANGRGRLLMLTDGGVDLQFDPSNSAQRTGRRAAELAPMIASAGFAHAADAVTRTAAAFALTERLTGIAMTRELLEAKTYLLSTAPLG